MSLNGYSWVEGNVINLTDATGRCVNNTVLPFLSVSLKNYLQPESLCIGSPPQTFSDCRNPVQNGLTTCPSMWGLYYASECSALSQTEIVFFGGSRGTGDINLKGPQPKCQTPVWYDLAGERQTYRYPGTGEPDDNGFVGKRQQAAQAQIPQSNTLIIGYSAGADSALIYAYDHRNSGHIMGVALLDGSLDGTRTDMRNLGCFPGDTRPGCADGRDIDVWSEMLNELLTLGIDVYFLDDAAGGGQSKVATYKPPSNANGRFNYDERLSVPHIDDINSGRRGQGTNNSNRICQDVLGWFGQDTSQCLIETPKDCADPF